MITLQPPASPRILNYTPSPYSFAMPLPYPSLIFSNDLQNPSPPTARQYTRNTRQALTGRKLCPGQILGVHTGSRLGISNQHLFIDFLHVNSHGYSSAVCSSERTREGGISRYSARREGLVRVFLFISKTSIADLCNIFRKVNLWKIGGN